MASLDASAGEIGGIRHVICPEAPAPLDLYSHATVYHDTVYVSCIQGFIPGTLEFPSDLPGDQARQALANLRTVLEAAGSSMAQVLKITLFMVDMTDFPMVNEAVNEAFPVRPPARSSIGVAELPRNAKVVVEAIAAVLPR